jgi:hypothetical protein
LGLEQPRSFFSFPMDGKDIQKKPVNLTKTIC